VRVRVRGSAAKEVFMALSPRSGAGSVNGRDLDDRSERALDHFLTHCSAGGRDPSPDMSFGSAASFTDNVPLCRTNSNESLGDLLLQCRMPTKRLAVQGWTPILRPVAPPPYHCAPPPLHQRILISGALVTPLSVVPAFNAMMELIQTAKNPLGALLYLWHPRRQLLLQRPGTGWLRYAPQLPDALKRRLQTMRRHLPPRDTSFDPDVITFLLQDAPAFHWSFWSVTGGVAVVPPDDGLDGELDFGLAADESSSVFVGGAPAAKGPLRPLDAGDPSLRLVTRHLAARFPSPSPLFSPSPSQPLGRTQSRPLSASIAAAANGAHRRFGGHNNRRRAAETGTEIVPGTAVPRTMPRTSPSTAANTRRRKASSRFFASARSWEADTE
jgi:hypothetical protein